LNSDLTNLTNPATGVLTADLAENQGEQSILTNEITNFQTQAAAQKIQLQAEFSAVNASLEEYPFLLQEVTAELGSIGTGALSTGTTTNTNTTPTSGESANSSSSGTSGTSS
jgi:hypothetical protein